MPYLPDPQAGRPRAWLLPGLCALFALALLGQELLLLLEIAPPDQPLATWRWRLLLPLGAVAIALLLPWRARWYFLGATGASLSLVLSADAAYYRFFGSLTSLRSASFAHQLWDVRDSLVALIDPAHLMVTLLLVGLALAGAALPDPGTRRARERIAGFALMLVTGALAALAWRTPIYEPTHHVGRNPWTLPAEHWGSTYSPVRFAVAFGPLNYHARDLMRWLGEAISRPEPLSASREGELRAWLEHKRALNATRSPLFGRARGRHVVLIQLESWQHLLVDRTVDGVEVTPCFNRLARSALVWDNILDVTSGGRTSDAEFAVHTGLLPDVRKPAAFHHVGSAAITLPRILVGLGYRTASFHGYDRAFWNRAYTHPDWGIEEMYFREAFESVEQLGLGASDRAVYHFVVDKLASWDPTPAMAFVISLSSHHPYLYTPPEYRSLFTGIASVREYGLTAPYLRSARYADDALCQLTAEMQERGLHERTLYVVYGDHDMGGIGATRPVAELGPEASSPTGDRVPLLIALPGEEAAIAAERDPVRATIGGLHDVFPTLLHLLGIDPPLGIQGTHLLVPAAQRDPLPLAYDGWYAVDSVLFGPRGPLPLGPVGSVRDVADAALAARRERALLEDLLDHRAQARIAGLHEPPRTRIARGD